MAAETAMPDRLPDTQRQVTKASGAAPITSLVDALSSLSSSTHISFPTHR
jgi:hypothetical protein